MEKSAALAACRPSLPEMPIFVVVVVVVVVVSSRIFPAYIYYTLCVCVRACARARVYIYIYTFLIIGTKNIKIKISLTDSDVRLFDHAAVVGSVANGQRDGRRLHALLDHADKQSFLQR